jgi:small conductance mechanosensitive channel
MNELNFDVTKHLDTVTEQLVAFFTAYGLKVIGGLVVLLAGWILSRWVSRAVGRALGRMRRVDDVLVPTLRQLASAAVMTVTVVIVLDKFGVEAATIIAVLGAAGLTIGLAVQGTLSNLAAGVMLLILRPFTVEELVEVRGEMGHVEKAGLFSVRLRTFQGQEVHLPNSYVWSGHIKNFSRKGVRRVDLVCRVSYQDDVRRALELAREEIQAMPEILPDPEPMLGVGEFAENGVELWVRPWTTPESYFDVRMGLLERIKVRFDAEGITIPVPQRVLHRTESAGEKEPAH